MAVNTTTQRISLEHPYTVPGILLMVGAVLLVAFDLGFFESCGKGSGICLDWGTHALGTAALVVFFILFLVGVLLVFYTGASTTVSSLTTRVAPDSPRPSPSPVTVVTTSPSAPTPSSPTTVNVNPPRSA
jgi:hypothetical protein